MTTPPLVQALPRRILVQGILYGNRTPTVTPFETGPVVAYTLLHFGVFALFGVLVTAMGLYLRSRHPRLQHQ